MRPGFVKGALLAAFLFAGTHSVAAAELRLSQPAISTIPELFILVAKRKKRSDCFPWGHICRHDLECCCRTCGVPPQCEGIYVLHSLIT
jgi:hypothetical protein